MLKLEPDVDIETKAAANESSPITIGEGSILIRILSAHILQSSAKTKLQLAQTRTSADAELSGA
jgi:hypothetical protein